VPGRSPLEVASELESLADTVLTYAAPRHVEEGRISASFDELVYDLEAFAWMGKYYAGKIRGAFHLHALREGLGGAHRAQAVAALREALAGWNAYADAATRNYLPQFLAKTRTVDWRKLAESVAGDLALAESEGASDDGTEY
jgi:hypothetical protein